MAEFKDKLLEKYKDKPFSVGDAVKISRSLFTNSNNDIEKLVNVKIVDVLDNNKYKVQQVNKYETYGFSDVVIVDKDDLHKDFYTIGHNPFKFNGYLRKLERVQFDLSGILLDLNISSKVDPYKKHEYVIKGFTIPEYNDNPYIYDENGNKVYYQRDYVWSVEDEQLFIESIYNGLDCGKIVIRKHDWSYLEKCVVNGNTEGLAFKDIVDGKQRIHTLKRFLNDEFKDLHGCYYSDLSKQAMHQFDNSTSLTYLRLTEDATDKDVIETFLMVNFSGKPMSKEHLDYVQKIKVKG